MADELDTPLARLLHARGRLPLEVLREALARVRATRDHDDRSLARTLVDRGLLGADEASALVAEANAPPAWRPGSVVAGRFRIERRLGQGGMGAVDEVTELSTGARRALKSLSSGSDRELLLRFRREGEALARVDRHPNVVRVHAAGQDPQRLWLLMDLEEGGDLARRLAGGAMAIDEVVRIGAALADGLAHVHRQGVLHRDLKPQNVLFDAGGTPKLTDFGLARTADARSLTQTGELLGTPAYMAPEQATGDVAALDERTDVYGLGAVLHHALTGRPPFEGSTPLAVLEQILEAPLVPPRRRRPDCPAWLDAVVVRALSRRPADRFPSASALRQALLDREAPRAGRARRRQVAAAAAALVVAGAAWSASIDDDPGAALAPPSDAAPARPVAGSPDVATDAAAPGETPAPRTADEALAHARMGASLPSEPPAWLAATESNGTPESMAMVWSAASEDPSQVTLARWVAEFLHSDAGRALAPEAVTLGLAWLARIIESPEAGPERGRAWSALGRAYRFGLGVTPDDRTAIACYERALALGCPIAAETFARARFDGTFLQRRDPAGALRLTEEVLSSGVRDDAGRWIACADLQVRLLVEHPEVGSDERRRALRAWYDRQEADPSPARALSHAYLAEAEGRVEQALADYGRLALVDAPEVRLPALTRWALLAQRTAGAVQEPIQRLEAAARATPPERAAALGLGQVHRLAGRVPEAASWLLAAAAPDDANAHGAVETRARLALGELARDELAADRPWPAPREAVLAGLRLVALTGTPEAAELAAALDRGDGSRSARAEDVLRRVEAQVGRAPDDAPEWLPQHLLASWPGVDAAPMQLLYVINVLLEPGSDAAAPALAQALAVRVVRETPPGPLQARGWTHLAKALQAGRGLARDDAAALTCFQVAVDLGSLAALEALALCHARGELGLPADPVRAFDVLEVGLAAHSGPVAEEIGAWTACVLRQSRSLRSVPPLRTPANVARVAQRLRDAAAGSSEDGDRRRRLEEELNALVAIAGARLDDHR